MPLTPIEWIAAIFVIIGLIKLIYIAINKQKWFDMVSPLYTNSRRTGWIFLILALLVLYYLLQTLSIVSIMAVMAFTSLLIGFSFMQYSKDFLPFAKKIYTKKFPRGIIIYIIIWLILSIWALKEIFF